MEPAQALLLLVQRLAGELAAQLQRRGLAGRLLILSATRDSGLATLRVPGVLSPRIEEASSEFQEPKASAPSFTMEDGEPPSLALVSASSSDYPAPIDEPVSLPIPVNRIHSMLPRPSRGHAVEVEGIGPFAAPMDLGIEGVSDSETLHPELRTQNATGRMQYAPTETRSIATRQPVSDVRTLTELAERLLDQVSSEFHISEGAYGIRSFGNVELTLSMSHFAPPEQLALPGMEPRDREHRLAAIRRQEDVLIARFGETPFRHLAAVEPESVLSEDRFRWTHGR
jgi:hypothetical protein